MDITRCIQAAVVRADMLICAVGPVVAYVAIVAGLVWLAVEIGKRI